MRDPDFEDRQRLERFLKWQEAAGRHRRARDRRTFFLCVGAVLGVLTVLVAGTLVRRSFDRPPPLAADQTRRPAEQLISPSSNGASESARPGAVSAAVEAEPSRAVEEVQTAAGEPKAEEEHSAVKPWRLARREPRTSRPSRQGVAARELPGRWSATVVTPEVPSVPSPDLPKKATVTKEVAPGGAPFLPQPVPATPGAGSTPHEVAVVTSALPPVPRADIAKSQRPGTMETVKRLIGYMPEVRAGKAIYRWVKSQPPADPLPPPFFPTPSPESR
jgi:hypothetical protein